MGIAIIVCITIIIVVLIIALTADDTYSFRDIIDSIYEGRKKVEEAKTKRKISEHTKRKE